MNYAISYMLITSNFPIKCMMKFLGLFRVVDPKHPRLIWFKPNLSLKIDIFCQVFPKKNSKHLKKKNPIFFSIFFQFFFKPFQLVFLQIMNLRKGMQGLELGINLQLGFRAMSQRAPKIAVFSTKLRFLMLLTRSI